MDFLKDGIQEYLVGTESGHLFKCSLSLSSDIQNLKTGNRG